MTVPVEIMLVEDNPGDIFLTKRAFRKSKIKNNITVIEDGENAINYLENIIENGGILPDIILLDINMPKLDGFEVLTIIKNNINFKHIPVVMLTTSGSELDIIKSYKKFANSYLKKPVEIDAFIKLIADFTDYWFVIAKLPRDTR